MVPGARPTNDISIEFEIRSKSDVLWFKMYSADHKVILHTSWLSWRVQTFLVIGWDYSKLQYSKFWSNFEFDRNTVSGTGAWRLSH